MMAKNQSKKSTSTDAKQAISQKVNNAQRQLEQSISTAGKMVSKNPGTSMALALAAGVAIGSAVTMMARRAKT